MVEETSVVMYCHLIPTIHLVARVTKLVSPSTTINPGVPDLSKMHIPPQHNFRIANFFFDDKIWCENNIDILVMSYTKKKKSQLQTEFVLVSEDQIKSRFFFF